LLHRLHDAAVFDDRLAHLLRQGPDLVAQAVDLVALIGDEILPARPRETADAARPVRVELVAEMLFEEIRAVDAMRFGKAEQAAFERDETAVDAVHLIDERFDAVVVELEALHQIDGLDAQLLEAALLRRRKIFRAEG